MTLKLEKIISVMGREFVRKWQNRARRAYSEGIIRPIPQGEFAHRVVRQAYNEYMESYKEAST